MTECRVYADEEDPLSLVVKGDGETSEVTPHRAEGCQPRQSQHNVDAVGELGGVDVHRVHVGVDH